MTNRTAPIKFTPATVREVAKRVAEFTDGYFALDTTGADESGGTRYFDAHQMKVWYGPEGARQACAYYIGGALGMAHAEGRPIPEGDMQYFQLVLAACGDGPQRRKSDAENWEARGRERARLRAETSK